LSTSTPNVPTDSTPAAGDRWDARPIAAGALRTAIVLAPLAVSSAVLLVVSHVWRAPAGGRHLWLAALAVVAVVVAFAVERAARRLLPLASLLRLTMLFPDRAPSRLRIARAAGTTGQQLDRLSRSDDDTAQLAAEKVLTLITALGNHDRKTRGHSERVRLYCDLLAEALHLPKAERDRLRWGALLHDVGKLDIAPTILNKPAKLSDREFARIREHPSVGAEIAAPLLPWLGEWGGGIVDHHERWDGRGYPAGRASTEISRAGRIVGLVDAFETMTAARVYKKAMTTRAARVELAACAGTQFDPDYVRAFLAISLPRVLWAMGPLAFLVQLPFLRSLAKLGSQATQISVQGASTAGVAAAASVLGIAAPAVIAAHTHPHSHSHSALASAVARNRSAGGSSYQSGGTASTGTTAGTESVTESVTQSVAAGRVTTRHDGVQVQPVATHPHGVSQQQPGSAPGSQPGGSTPAPATGASDPLSIEPTTAYVVAGTLAAIDVLTDNSASLLASTLSIATSPLSGSASVGTGGSIAYQPQSGFHGIDRVVFEVCDASGACGSAPVTIHVLSPDQSGTNFSGVNLSGMDLQGFDFTDAVLSGTDLAGANLTNVNFNGADLTDANLSSSSVRNVTANGTDLSGANLSGITGGSAPHVTAINLTTTLGQPISINVSTLVSDPNVPIDWSTLAITKNPAHGSVRITGPHTILYTPAPGLVSVDQIGFSVSNVLTFSATGSQRIAVVL
jgi:HD domain/Pentapeptide repeats (8 copies)/Bacterial Ig domain